MMTLKEMVRERKAAEPPSDAPSGVAEAPTRAIQIHTWNGEKWVLPWGYFYSARLDKTADGEQLVLRIAHHEVVLDGLRLALLLPAIADHQLDCLRDLPPKFQAEADSTVPFIGRISVRLPAEPSQAGGEAP